MRIMLVPILCPREWQHAIGTNLNHWSKHVRPNSSSFQVETKGFQLTWTSNGLQGQINQTVFQWSIERTVPFFDWASRRHKTKTKLHYSRKFDHDLLNWLNSFENSVWLSSHNDPNMPILLFSAFLPTLSNNNSLLAQKHTNIFSSKSRVSY